jgi:hypothetical protein
MLLPMFGTSSQGPPLDIEWATNLSRKAGKIAYIDAGKSSVSIPCRMLRRCSCTRSGTEPDKSPEEFPFVLQLSDPLFIGFISIFAEHPPAPTLPEQPRPSVFLGAVYDGTKATIACPT